MRDGGNGKYRIGGGGGEDGAEPRSKLGRVDWGRPGPVLTSRSGELLTISAAVEGQLVSPVEYGSRSGSGTVRPALVSRMLKSNRALPECGISSIPVPVRGPEFPSKYVAVGPASPTGCGTALRRPAMDWLVYLAGQALAEASPKEGTSCTGTPVNAGTYAPPTG
jgi:hypothetical protein